jgi:hypothetical protein
MRFKPTRIVAAIAVIGAVAAGGAAFTFSNTVPSSVAGFGSASVTGGTVTSLTYDLSTDGYYITTAHIVFTGDKSADTASIGFSDGTTVNGDGQTDGPLNVCGTGTYDGTTSTTFVCDLTSADIVTADENQADVTLTGPSS